MVTRADKLTANDRKSQIYSDFLADLNTHPVSGDIVRFVNENAVIRSIKNLMQTNKGERLYQPKLGGDISKLLFEPMGDSMTSTISQVVRQTIEKHEPRARVLDVIVVADYDNNAYNVTVKFLLINNQNPISFNVTLSRVR